MKNTLVILVSILFAFIFPIIHFKEPVCKPVPTIFKTLGQIGASGIVVGIITVIVGVSVGVVSIISGARALKLKGKIMI